MANRIPYTRLQGIPLVDASDLSVLVLCERWPGATGLSAFSAFQRAGAMVNSVCEFEVVPLRWPVGTLRAAGRIVRPFAVREFNRQLLQQARAGAFDLFIAFKGMFVEPTTVGALKAAGITTFCFYPDVSFLAHGPLLPQTLPRYDWIFTTKTFGIDDLRSQLGCTNVSLLHHAYDPDVHRPRRLSEARSRELACDVSFIGTWSPAKERLITHIVRERPALKVRVDGDQWDRAETDARRCWSGHAVTGAEYASAISAAKVNLGLLSEQRRGASAGDRITSRTFHIPACGGLLLHQRNDEVRALFREDHEFVAFDGPDELVSKVDWLLADDERRCAIARAGRAAVERAHSWDHRIVEIVGKYRQIKAGRR